jgi:hypothetical protein
MVKSKRRFNRVVILAMLNTISRNHELLLTHRGHKMFKYIVNFLTAFQKARVAAHFARMGDYKAAQAIYRD